MEKSTAEMIVKVYAVFAWISALILLFATFAILIGGSMFGVFSTMTTADFRAAGIVGAVATTVAAVLICLALFYVIVGFGLWQHKSWARVATLVFSILSLFSFPFGTILGGLGIWLFGFDPAIKALFGVKSPKTKKSKSAAKKTARKPAKKASKKKKK